MTGLNGGEKVSHLYWRYRPVDKPRQYSTFRAYSLPCQLPENLTRQLKIVAQKENSTPFIMVLSTLFALLYRYSGCEDIVMGATFSNRNHPDRHEYIGSLLYLRVGLQGNTQTGYDAFSCYVDVCS